MPAYPLEIWLFMIAVGLIAGLVKGVVGFAMPLVFISGLAIVLPPEITLAALIIPTLVTNVWQALRQGLAAAMSSVRVHWRYLAVVCVMILLAAQLVNHLPRSAMLLILGVPVTVFATTQLVGWRLHFPPEARRRYELGIGAFAGLLGGLAGTWGPPTVLYLTALETPKTEQMRVQGVVYGLGAVMLTAGHLRSGILNGDTLPLSAILVVPGLIGLLLGFQVQDRLNQALFRRVTLLILILAGLNLVRRGLFG